jgi:Ca-activated chloride channel homolog
MRTTPVRYARMFALVLVLLAISSLSHAQDSLPGYVRITVIDSATKKPLPGVQVTLEPLRKTGVTGAKGRVTFPYVPMGTHTLWISHDRYIVRQTTINVERGDTIRLKFTLDSVTSYRRRNGYSEHEVNAGNYDNDAEDAFGMFGATRRSSGSGRPSRPVPPSYGSYHHNYVSGEQYIGHKENTFLRVEKEPLSTFSIDVDRASYSIVRKYLSDNALPPQDAVRVEEMINYFKYDHPARKGNDPISIFTDVAPCPWQPQHRVVQIALKGRELEATKLPPSNIVFLIDVSGSMAAADKLPLVKQAFRLLVNELKPSDRVAIVVYAGAAGLVLPSTAGSDKQTILDAIHRLEAGGSTAGAAGIQLAYKVAKESFIDGGNNRVILATDGDFNVGVSSDVELVKLIEEKRKDNIFLTVLGFGDGNYQDHKMEQLADKGNGNYAYCDNLLEAQKVFVTELSGTLHTIAKDVKLQIEFNPRYVQSYRLIGYENRKLENEDFNDDLKDAGELGAGHEVTALYEIVPPGVLDPIASKVDPLKYQVTKTSTSDVGGDEILTVKFRYKEPKEEKSKLVTSVLRERVTHSVSSNLKLAMSVAGFGMLLRNSQL